MNRQKRRQLAGGSPCDVKEREKKDWPARGEGEENITLSLRLFPLLSPISPSHLPRRRDNENRRRLIRQASNSVAVRGQDDGVPPPAAGFPANAIGKVLKKKGGESAG